MPEFCPFGSELRDRIFDFGSIIVLNSSPGVETRRRSRRRRPTRDRHLNSSRSTKLGRNGPRTETDFAGFVAAVGGGPSFGNACHTTDAAIRALRCWGNCSALPSTRCRAANIHPVNNAVIAECRSSRAPRHLSAACSSSAAAVRELATNDTERRQTKRLCVVASITS